MNSEISGVVYVIKFSEKIAGHAGYYVGSTALLRLNERFNEHCTGRGARLTEVAWERGIGMQIIHTVPTNTLKEARKLERTIKNRKSTSRWLKTQGVSL